MQLWNDSFLETFDVKNWSASAYAYTFKYYRGSFLHFSLKKRNLLLDVDPKLAIDSQINLIVVALPNYARSLLRKKELMSIDSLMSALRQAEPVEKKRQT